MWKLTIKDQEFELVSATLEPFISDDASEPAKNHRFVWGIAIEAKEKEIGEASWEPSFKSERLLETKPNELDGWQSLVGRQGAWGDEDEKGLLYTFSHEPVINVSWRFESAKSGRLVFILDGQSRFDHPGGYVGLLPIHIEAELDYAPIPMGRGAKEPACRRQITRFGIKDPFEFRVVKGVSYMVPTNYPNP